mmetsp:Transcript_18496/g.25450  ORF Transcript_18496/g.25450 Transcript_18496/m.25450 type:complete len:406 (-) Transcript_18496:139-1356(-)|eukprot:CAMPEP_0185731108 /NCGR_PEP_ID=MMETSP1171-20130828/11912_1 /TAXON_ID=374046 /ORGANISM="Helicotheca tamensis, Strain CCMP826" /LENGTH=405 /DNA_ID=CAMNT_0028400297 /DNA_START=90 /DNA_END=1307 /DNA_ORIENTATION=+
MPPLSERLKRFDAHSSVSNEFRVRTFQGAFLSVATLVAILYLIHTELKYNLTPTILDHVHVNATTPDGLEMEFDVTFPNVRCALLSIDAADPTGQAQSLHIDRKHRVWKHRLRDGKMFGRRSPFELGDTFHEVEHVEKIARNLGLKEDGEGNDPKDSEDYESADDEEECGSCYGAGDEGECCNTCDDVKRAYQRKGWHLKDIHTVKQCKHATKSDAEEGEGCNVHGIVALSTGGGNLHVTPGRGLEKMGTKNEGLLSITDFIQEAFESFNVSHTVNKIRFGKEFPGHVHQLDGRDQVVEDAYGMYQYYIQVVPTLYRFLNGTTIQTNQYSVTEHMRHVNPGSGRGLPGVFFFYEVSALHVEIEEYRKGWIHFFTSVCAVVGGVFTFMGMADKMIYTKMKGNDSLG